MNQFRRDFLIRATALGVGVAYGTLHQRAGGKPAMAAETVRPSVFRAFNMGMKVGSAGPGGGTHRSIMKAANFIAPFEFQRFRVMQHLFTQQGPLLHDAMFPTALNFGYAFAPAARFIFSGIEVRPKKANFSVGAQRDFLAYDPSNWDLANLGGVAVSDVIDLGVKTNCVDYWVAQSVPPSIRSPNNNLLISETDMDNLIPHGIGLASSGKTDFVAEGSYQIDKRIGPVPALAGGIGLNICPMGFLIEVPESIESVLVLSDSHGQGFNAGEGAHFVKGVEYGGPSGDSQNNVSWLDKGIAANGLGYFSIGKSSDGDKNWITAANWQYRKQGAILGNPTRVIDGDATNTVTGAVGSLTTSSPATFARGDAIRHISARKVFLCLAGALIGTNPRELAAATMFGQVINLNGGSFMYMGTFCSALFNAVAGLGKQLLMSDQVKNQWPTLPYIRTGLLPQPTTTDSFTTIANQKPEGNTGGGAGSKRNCYMTMLQHPAVKAILRYDFLLRPDSIVENDNLNFDGLVKVDDGTVPNKYEFGGHLTAYGHSACASAVSAASMGK